MLIRCGDCKYFHPFVITDRKGMCYLKDDETDNVWTDKNAACSAGERKENPDEKESRIPAV